MKVLSNQSSDCIAIFLSLIVSFLGQHLKNVQLVENSYFHPTEDTDSDHTMFGIQHKWYLHLELDENMNSPPIAQFMFSNIVLRH